MSDSSFDINRPFTFPSTSTAGPDAKHQVSPDSARLQQHEEVDELTKSMALDILGDMDLMDALAEEGFIEEHEVNVLADARPELIEESVTCTTLFNKNVIDLSKLSIENFPDNLMAQVNTGTQIIVQINKDQSDSQKMSKLQAAMIKSPNPLKSEQVHTANRAIFSSFQKDVEQGKVKPYDENGNQLDTKVGLKKQGNGENVIWAGKDYCVLPDGVPKPKFKPKNNATPNEIKAVEDLNKQPLSLYRLSKSQIKEFNLFVIKVLDKLLNKKNESKQESPKNPVTDKVKDNGPRGPPESKEEVKATSKENIVPLRKDKNLQERINKEKLDQENFVARKRQEDKNKFKKSKEEFFEKLEEERELIKSRITQESYKKIDERIKRGRR